MSPARRIAASIAIVALWAAVWGATVSALSAIALVVDPAVIDAGERPHEIVWIGVYDGAITGAVFALLLVLGEWKREVAEVSYLRAVSWGVSAAAILRLTAITDVHFSNSAVVAAASAALSVALARMLGSTPSLHAPERPS